MRRSSIVAPLLLIAVGGLFLARNLYPDIPLLDYLAGVGVLLGLYEKARQRGVPGCVLCPGRSGAE